MAWHKRKGMLKIKRQTHELDASDQIVGKLASKVARILVGKHKPGYLPHQDTGDFVKIKNVEKLVFTGKKWEQKMHYSTSNRPGGLKSVSVAKLKIKNPGQILKHAVKYMLPKNRTQKARMHRLKIV